MCAILQRGFFFGPQFEGIDGKVYIIDYINDVIVLCPIYTVRF